ncbi:MAG: site-specific DNA-methyltransferase [Leptospiraceae bacterium]|nr:site-specific DNA-methyltransferase [Leptospiraceae bacterium]
MSKYQDKYFDMAIVDPPYGASTKANWNLDKKHNLEGFGGEWKLSSSSWDLLKGHESFEFTFQWIKELKRLIKPTGSIWIHSTYHNSGIVNVLSQIIGLEIINEVVWYKRNAFPNLSNRRLTASHETILWLHTGEKKRQYYFDHETAKKVYFIEDKLKMPEKQLRTVWDIPNNKSKSEIIFGNHPTQKPLRLIERMLLISAQKGWKLLVPFAGSGTELLAGLDFGMEVHGFEINKEYYDLANKRISHYFEEKVNQLKFSNG